jgi:hypothetical protein
MAHQERDYPRDCIFSSMANAKLSLAHFAVLCAVRGEQGTHTAINVAHRQPSGSKVVPLLLVVLFRFIDMPISRCTSHQHMADRNKLNTLTRINWSNGKLPYSAPGLSSVDTCSRTGSIVDISAYCSSEIESHAI